MDQAESQEQQLLAELNSLKREAFTGEQFMQTYSRLGEFYLARGRLLEAQDYFLEANSLATDSERGKFLRKISQIEAMRKKQAAVSTGEMQLSKDEKKLDVDLQFLDKGYLLMSNSGAVSSAAVLKGTKNVLSHYSIPPLSGIQTTTSLALMKVIAKDEKKTAALLQMIEDGYTKQKPSYKQDLSQYFVIQYVSGIFIVEIEEQEKFKFGLESLLYALQDHQAENQASYDSYTKTSHLNSVNSLSSLRLTLGKVVSDNASAIAKKQKKQDKEKDFRAIKQMCIALENALVKKMRGEEKAVSYEEKQK